MAHSKQPATSLAGQARKADELIDYQEGAIVSRVVVSGKTGNATLFAFDAGQELSEHTAPFDALVHVLDGEAEVIVSGRSIPVRAGELVVMPANEPHAVKAPTRFRMMLTMVRA